MRTKSTWLAVVLALGIAGGCGDDGGVITVPDGGTTPDSGTDSGVRPDSGPVTDGNDSFADAQDIEVGGDAVEDTISPPGDLDYFTFEGTADTWMVIATTANEEDDPEMVDTVISLYDSSMTLIAENDDGLPRRNTDSELVTRLPSTGTYYVLVQEWSTWAEEAPEGNSTFDYELTVFEIPAAGAGNVNVDAEAGDDLASAQAITFDGQSAFVLGTSEDATDVDVFSFSTLETRPLNQFTLMPAGAEGYGSTGLPARMWITNAAGDEIIARIPTAGAAPREEFDFSPSLPAGDYLLWVEHPTAAGANDFYVIKVLQAADNPAEMSELTNGLPAGAESLTIMANPDFPTARFGYVLARLPDATDVDYFSVTTMGTEQITVGCSSRSGGSGIVGFTADVLDALGMPLTPPATATETETETVLIEDVTVPAADTYLVRLTRGAQDPEVTGDWARCVVILAPPAATP